MYSDSPRWPSPTAAGVAGRDGARVGGSAGIAGASRADASVHRSLGRGDFGEAVGKTERAIVKDCGRRRKEAETERPCPISSPSPHVGGHKGGWLYLQIAMKRGRPKTSSMLRPLITIPTMAGTRSCLRTSPVMLTMGAASGVTSDASPPWAATGEPHPGCRTNISTSTAGAMSDSHKPTRPAREVGPNPGG